MVPYLQEQRDRARDPRACAGGPGHCADLCPNRRCWGPRPSRESSPWSRRRHGGSAALRGPSPTAGRARPWAAGWTPTCGSSPPFAFESWGRLPFGRDSSAAWRFRSFRPGALRWLSSRRWSRRISSASLRLVPDPRRHPRCAHIVPTQPTSLTTRSVNNANIFVCSYPDINSALNARIRRIQFDSCHRIRSISIHFLIQRKKPTDG